MKKWVLLLSIISIALLLFTSIGYSEGESGKKEVVTNKTVLKMVRAELGDELIIKKIKTSKTDFDLSTDAIIELKEAGVSEKVIEAMMGDDSEGPKPQQTQKLLAPQVPQNTYSGNVGNDYYVLIDGKLVEITPSKAFVAVSMKQSVKRLIPFFFSTRANDKWVYVKGEKADFRINSTLPIFYTRVKPILVELFKLDYHPKKNIRYAIFTGSVTSTELNTKNNIDFDYEKSKNGFYKIVPKEPLSAGEYAISDQNSVTQGIICAFGINKLE